MEIDFSYHDCIAIFISDGIFIHKYEIQFSFFFFISVFLFLCALFSNRNASAIVNLTMNFWIREYMNKESFLYIHWKVSKMKQLMAQHVLQR